ncbi:MAG: CarD family transcriptional regulator [Candidatus Promineifilaceae bacterium]|nr:CarD family transcriptional regulator [Candidatus Promineifilaceae bacterium]
MTDKTPVFETGDWIVHLHHGVGQIQSRSVKRIGDHESEYFRIEMRDSTLWVPVDKMDEDTFRPIADEEEFNEALEVLQESPYRMASNFNKRKSRIRKLESKHSFVALARIVRDLWARQKRKSLSNTEETALRRTTKRLLSEWAICTGEQVEEAEHKLYSLLRESHADVVAAD